MKLLLIFKEVHKQFHTSEDFNFLYLYLARPTCLHDCPLLTPVWLLQVLPLSDPPRTAQRHPPPPTTARSPSNGHPHSGSSALHPAPLLRPTRLLLWR